jgi:hypothetical protein
MKKEKRFVCAKKAFQIGTLQNARVKNGACRKKECVI